ncbi:MAG: NfeD family protein [Candidatus Neomarinimicrobiota bacterium]|nr:NfeD family protein [Candidatus Neomarinimicrobiota bacterium]
MMQTLSTAKSLTIGGGESNFDMMIFRILSLVLPIIFSSATSAGVVYRVPIQSTIDLGLPPFIERAIGEAEAEGAEAIIFDIDTFGGRVDGATQIKDAILDSKILTVAFINRRAISAGALISLSCEKIYMTDGGTIGAATAVDMSGKKGSEKVISYMREEMASTAESRGRSEEIARGMVDEELKFTHLVVDGDSVEVSDIEGRKEGKLISLTTSQALKYGISDGVADSFEEVLEQLDLSEQEVVDLRVNWSEKLVRFLTDPTVSSLLMTLGFLGLLFEIQSPGWGVPGTMGIVLLSLFFGSTILTELATMTELLIIGVGVALALVEILVIPGFGFVGILGGITIMFGLFTMLLPAHPMPSDISSASWGFTISIFGGFVALYLMGRALIKTEFWKKITLPFSEKSSEGYSTSLGLENLVGETGSVASDLRPSGWAVVGEEKLFVVSEGEFIESGDSVIILSVEGNRIVVRKVNNED